jgi:hypothetical protein
MGKTGAGKIPLIVLALSVIGLSGEAWADGLRWPGEPSLWAPSLSSPVPPNSLSWPGGMGLNRPAAAGPGLGTPPERSPGLLGAHRFMAPGRSLWDPIGSMEVGATLSRQGGDGWWWTAAPSLGAFREGAAGWGPIYAYGAVLSAAREVSAGRRIGLGVGVFDRLDRLWAFPFLAVDWQFTERLRLTNPLATGPAGPAGLELKYRLSDAWEIGAGGAYRNARFPLDAAGFAPYRVGEERGMAAFLHLARSLGPRFSVDVYAGALLGGELRLENSAGVELYNEELAPSPVFGFSLTGRF